MENRITQPVAVLLSVTSAAFLAVGFGGAVATYKNLYATLGSTSEAASVVLAGEGAVLVASLVCISLALLGQATPALARAALWLLPLAGSSAGAYLADAPKERVVYALSPVAMAVAAEGLNLVARRVVTFLAGRDVNADSRNAALVAAITYHQGRSQNHPSGLAKRYSKRKVWQLAGQLTVTDPELVVGLTDVQSHRLTAGADVALSSLLGGGVAKTVALPATPAPQDVAPVAEAVADGPFLTVGPPRTGMATAMRPVPSPAPVITSTEELEAVVAEAAEVIKEDDRVELLTVKQVADRCGVKPPSVRSWVNRGKLPVHSQDADGRNLFHPLDVAKL